jgi:hypothetical protein
LIGASTEPLKVANRGTFSLGAPSDVFLGHRHNLICPRIIGCDHGGRGPGADRQVAVGGALLQDAWRRSCRFTSRWITNGVSSGECATSLADAFRFTLSRHRSRARRCRSSAGIDSAKGPALGPLRHCMDGAGDLLPSVPRAPDLSRGAVVIPGSFPRRCTHYVRIGPISGSESDRGLWKKRPITSAFS